MEPWREGEGAGSWDAESQAWSHSRMGPRAAVLLFHNLAQSLRAPAVPGEGVGLARPRSPHLLPPGCAAASSRRKLRFPAFHPHQDHTG